MGKVIAGATVSLDGFIARPDDTVGPLFDWYGTGETEVRPPGGDWLWKVSPASAAHLRELLATTGALVIGRRTFDITGGFGGQHPFAVPVFVVTHAAPQNWAHPDAPFTFVTEGVERAVALAKATAGDKNVAVGMASLVRQCLQAGLLDEIGIDLAPVLLGAGVRYLDALGADPIPLERIRTVEGSGVTHLRFRVAR